MPYVTPRDGCKIFYRAEGPPDAPGIVFSNSLGCDHGMWQAQAEALRHSYRVVRYDQRGHGASDAPEGTYELARLADDVIELADHLGLETFHFCGLSMGGLTGQWLGARHGQRIGKLVLANTSPHFPPPQMWDERIDLVSKGGVSAIANAVLARFFSESFHQANPGTVADFRHVLENTSSTGYLGCCKMLRQVDVVPELDRIDRETLVISGRHDQSTPPERGELIAGRIAGARHLVLDSAHLSNVERSIEFTRAIAGFIGDGGLPLDNRFTTGMTRRRQALGDDWVDRSIRNRSEFTSDFQDLITRYAWGEIWTRPGLDETTRRLLVLATCAALSRWEEFDLHLGAALRAGINTDTIREVLMQTAIYAGVPAANTAFQRAAKIIAAQGTTDDGS